MKWASGLILVAAVVAGGWGKNDLGAPFQTQITELGAGKYQYLAASTVTDPAQGQSGEQLRLHFLDRYFASKGICGNGYDIVRRATTAQMTQLARRGDRDESDGWVTYIVQCRT